MCPPPFSNREIAGGVAPAAIDDVLLLRLVPWLALRHDFADGSFVGRGEEQSISAGFITAQAGAILEALGLREKLPHIVRTKLDSWPGCAVAELAKPASSTPLAVVMRESLSLDAVAFARVLDPFLSSDGGYMLKPGRRQPGLMAAAHHLLVEVRPAWFALRDLPVPPVGETATRHFLSQLFPAFST
jgi:hypothetical protein